MKLVPILLCLMEVSSETLWAWKFLYLKLVNEKFSLSSHYRTVCIITFILGELQLSGVLRNWFISSKSLNLCV